MDASNARTRKGTPNKKSISASSVRTKSATVEISSGAATPVTTLLEGAGSVSSVS